MKTIVKEIRRAARRRLKRLAHRGKGPESRRALAVLLVAEGTSVTEVAQVIKAGRSSVYRWLGWYELEGEEGLIAHQEGNRDPRSVSEEVVSTLQRLLEEEPSAWGYLRSSWTSELLAKELNSQLGSAIHASTIRRLLPWLGFGWRRSRPTLCIKDPKKVEKMAAIDEVLERPGKRCEVFYVDEVDIDLNPKTGFGWTAKGQQKRIPTPGKNCKRYLAGALHARTGKVIWVEGESKSSDLFLALLNALRSAYRGAREIVLILDNYIIHKSRKTQRWLASEGEKFRLLFQPAYHPWVNRIERLWKALHDTITRNHHYSTMEALMGAVRQFMGAVQPFPGAGHALAKAA